MALIDESAWRGKVFSGGWSAGDGGDAPVIEPATGQEIGRTGIASPPMWPARLSSRPPRSRPGPRRPIPSGPPSCAAPPTSGWPTRPTSSGWGIGESGKIVPAMQFETHVMRGLDLARQIPTGVVHINEQTVDDEPNIPFGGLGASGTGARFGGTANLEAFTDTRWVTIRGDITPYPF
jgi:hypothetical protein